MKKQHAGEIHRINHMASELQSIYHLSSLKFGISDSVSTVLYAICVTGNECMLCDVYKNSGVSKQTVNSAIRGLEADGIVYLEQVNGRSKKVVLTSEGQEFVKNTVARLYQAEVSAFDSWTDEEIDTYLRLIEKYNNCLRAQIEKL